MGGQENNNNVLRNRKNKRNKKTRSSSSSNENKTENEQQQQKHQQQLDGKDQEDQEGDVLEDESLSDTFFKHPLIKVLKILLIPYLIYKTMYIITLKHPEIINNAVSSLGLLPYPLLRPSQQITDPKQVLIVGAEIADNKLIASSLHKLFHYEIVHETFDTQHYFCRDGSVSWFQIMRFLNQQQPLDPSTSKEQIMNTWKELCLDRSHSLIEFFHPKQYDKGTNCSSSSYFPDILTTQKSSSTSWSPCWAKQCLTLVNSIWGCAWKKGEDEKEGIEESSCPNKFNKILHQVRHPLDSIDILNSTICSNNYPKLNDVFFNLIKGWFPNREWDDDISISSSSSSSCTDAMGWYIIDFQSTLLQARYAGLIDGMFQIENTSPCDIVNMAGLLDEHTALYWDKRNSPKISEQCRGDNIIMDNNANNAAATSPDTFTRIKEESNGIKHHNDNRKKLKKIEDFTSNSQLKKELKELISKLGYDNNNDDDNNSNNSEQSEFL